MNTETRVALATLIVGLFIGGISTYVALSNNDAIASEKFIQLEGCTKKNEAAISKIGTNVTRIEGKIENLNALHTTMKELAVSTRGLTTALVRLEERQKHSDEIIKTLTLKIERNHE